MIAVLAGGIALVVILMLLRALAGADIGLVTKGVRYSGAVVLLFVAIGLAAIDKVGLSVLAASFAWGLFTGGHAWPVGWSFRSASGGNRDRNRARWTSYEEPTTQAGSMMSRAVALNVLGLEAGATPDEINAAHKRLIMQNHPDRGGTTYLAAQINEARDVLLNGRGA
jgi:hypothetical protein